MGTNFYVKGAGHCRCCGQPTDSDLHIGKSSMGWTFALMVYPDKGINTLDDWKEFLKTKTIHDEYGQVIEYDDLMERITDRSREDRPTIDLALNHAVLGPNNLLRRQIDGRHCIGYSEGTWDYMAGEFF